MWWSTKADLKSLNLFIYHPLNLPASTFNSVGHGFRPYFALNRTESSHRGKHPLSYSHWLRPLSEMRMFIVTPKCILNSCQIALGNFGLRVGWKKHNGSAARLNLDESTDATLIGRKCSKNLI